jgi:hypothetical protein
LKKHNAPAVPVCKYALILVLLLPVRLTAQIAADFPYLHQGNLEGVKVNSERSFTSESLFGYMDGGAELYLEFGFSQLVVSEIDYMGSDFKIEVFKMNGPEQAFGIYSVSFFKCDSKGDVTPFSCSTKYQFQFCKGRYYVNIINNFGSSSGVATAKELAARLSDMIDEDTFEPAGYFPGRDIQNFSRLVLVKGNLGLYNGASEFETLLDGAEDYTAVIGYAVDNTYISVRFLDDSGLSGYLDSMYPNLNPEQGKEAVAGEDLFATLKSDTWIIFRSQTVN